MTGEARTCNHLKSEEEGFFLFRGAVVQKGENETLFSSFSVLFSLVPDVSTVEGSTSQRKLNKAPTFGQNLKRRVYRVTKCQEDH